MRLIRVKQIADAHDRVKLWNNGVVMVKRSNVLGAM